MPSVWLVGHGFLGRALARFLRERGWSVCSMDAASSSGADVIGDAAELSLWHELREMAVRPDAVVFAQATRGGDEQAYARCYGGILKAADELFTSCDWSPHVIFCSSTSVCTGCDGAVVDECSDVRPTGARARLLHEAERAVLARVGLVLRLGALYGAGRLELLRRYEVGVMPVAGSMDRWLNYSLREQVVEWMHLLMSERVTGLRHLVTDSFTKREGLELMREHTGQPFPSEASTPAASRRGARSLRITSCHTNLAPEGARCMRAWLHERRSQ